MPAPRRKKGTGLGSKAEAGCAKCCSYCRLSPFGSAVCYSTIVLVLVICFIYILGSALSGPTEGRNPDSLCSTQFVALSLNLTSSDTLYLNYLAYTGVIILFLIVGLIISCCICCGLFCSFPKAVKIISCIAIIPASLLILLFLVWISIGTYLTERMDSDRIWNTLVCRHIVIYIIFMYITLLILIGYFIIILIWKLHDVCKEDKSSYTKVAKSAKSSDSGGVVGNVGALSTGAKLISVI